MIKNERGLTLVELLAAIAILGMVMAVLSAVILNGMKASEHNSTNQMLQQEANYIVETVRSEYLKKTEDDIHLEVSDDQLLMNGKLISEGYHYTLGESTIDKNKPSSVFTLTIEKESLSYTVDTTFSKLQ